MRRLYVRVATLNDKCNFRHLKKRWRRKIVGSCTIHASSLVLRLVSKTRAFVVFVSTNKKALSHCSAVNPDDLATRMRMAYQFQISKKYFARSQVCCVLFVHSLFDVQFSIYLLKMVYFLLFIELSY